jgi:hypothetical protein
MSLLGLRKVAGVYTPEMIDSRLSETCAKTSDPGQAAVDFAQYTEPHRACGGAHPGLEFLFPPFACPGLLRLGIWLGLKDLFGRALRKPSDGQGLGSVGIFGIMGRLLGGRPVYRKSRASIHYQRNIYGRCITGFAPIITGLCRARACSALEGSRSVPCPQCRRDPHESCGT